MNLFPTDSVRRIILGKAGPHLEGMRFRRPPSEAICVVAERNTRAVLFAGVGGIMGVQPSP